MRHAHPAPPIHAAVLAASLLLLAAAPLDGAMAQQRRASTSPSSVAPPPDGWSRAPRWQAALRDGSYLWEITPAGLRGDTLLARQADSVLRVPLERLDELRLLRPTERSIIVGGGGVGGGTLATLSGADDAVYELARFPVAERRRIVERILVEYPPPAGAAEGGRARP